MTVVVTLVGAFLLVSIHASAKEATRGDIAPCAVSGYSAS
jgi:hypothetical protein